MKFPRITASAFFSVLVLSLIFLFWFFVSAENSKSVSMDGCKKLGLPVLSVETDKNKPIKRKDKFVKASFTAENFSGRCRIRGHGNSTWKTTFTQKKPYLLKLDESLPLFGMAPGQKWILMANSCDRSMLRNFYAEYLAHEVWNRMKWSPQSKFVTLFVNGKYLGLYGLTEKIDIAENRVEFSGEGFLAEIDSHNGRPYDFKSSAGLNFHIRQPETSAENYARYEKKILEAEKALYSPEWKSAEGYRKFFDLDSLVDWYLLAEFSKNYDAKFYNSVFMTFDFDAQKIFMGPPWDHDIAFGNTTKGATTISSGFSDEIFPGRFAEFFHRDKNNSAAKDYDGFLINQSYWYYRLFCDEEFALMVRERYAETRKKLAESLDWISAQGKFLNDAAELNDSVWHILGSGIWPRAEGYRERKTYESEVNFLVQWCRNRMNFFDDAFAEK